MNEKLPQRKSPRLSDFDYSQSGVYLVTICTYRRLPLFGAIRDAALAPSPLGILAQHEIEHLPLHWQQIEIDCAVVMPNHVHILIVIFDSPKSILEGDPLVTYKPPPTLGHIIGNYKSAVTRLARQGNLIELKGFVWQGRYHDHIIRSEQTLNTIREYVLNNPARWQEDTFYGQK